MKALFILFLSMSLIDITAQSLQDCILKKDQDGIKVYTCHADDSKFKIIKASFIVQATTSQLITELLNISDYDQWQYNTINPEILKRISDSEMIYYAEVEAPWPVSNRDMIVHFKILKALPDGVITIVADGEPDFITEKEGLIRVPLSKSTWTIKPLDKKNLLVNYMIRIDPGGSVPAWMVNMVCAEAPYVSFKNLRKRIDDKYNSLKQN
jgi:hypothetical protein